MFVSQVWILYFKGMTLVYFITFFGGYKVWHFEVLGIQSVYIFEILMHGIPSARMVSVMTVCKLS